MLMEIHVFLFGEDTYKYSIRKHIRIFFSKKYLGFYASISLSLPRWLITRIGKVELRVPRDRAGLFETTVFARYQRHEQALLSAMAMCYLQGVSTRKIRRIKEALKTRRAAWPPPPPGDEGSNTLPMHGVARLFWTPTPVAGFGWRTWRLRATADIACALVSPISIRDARLW